MEKSNTLNIRKEMICSRQNGLRSADNFPYGWSPLQSIQQEVEIMIQSTRWNKEFYHNNAVPDGLVSLPMEQDALERFKVYWEQEVKGKPHKLIFLYSIGL